MGRGLGMGVFGAGLGYVVRVGCDGGWICRYCDNEVMEIELGFEWWGWVGNGGGESFVTGMADTVGIVSDSVLVLIGMGMRCVL